MRRLLQALGVTAALAVPAAAADPAVLPATWPSHRPAPVRPIDCPPATLIPPGNPARPPDPTQPPLATPVADPLARAPETGTLSAATFNPNMFGDIFGGQQQTVTLTRSRDIQFLVVGTAPPSRFGPSPPATVSPLFYRGSSFSNVLDPRFVGSVVVLTDNGGRASFAAPRFFTLVPVPSSGNPPLRLPLRENPTVTANLQALNPAARLAFLAANSNALLQGSIDGFGDFFLSQGYRITTTETFNLLVPLPSAGGVVGRTKLSDDNNPLPQDRLIFNYDFFSNTVLGPGGVDVSRFSPGFEKTFFDRRASVEMRFPFASTLDSTLQSNGVTGRATEFGDIHLTLKALLLRGDAFNVAAGVGLAFPTAADTVLRGPDGNDLLRVKNQSYILTPYIAAAWSPGERFFAQAWLQVGVDTTGSPVLADATGTGLVRAGKLYDQTLLQTDVQLGYWLVRNDRSSILRGLAPFFEVHYNTPLEGAKSIQAGNLAIANRNPRYDEVNLSAGVAAQVGTNLLLSAGVTVPVGGRDDEFFDAQFGLRANWFFGPTARARELSGAVAATGGLTAPGEFTPPASLGVPGLQTAVADPLARAPETGTLAAATANPNFFGDLIGVSANRRLAGVPIRIPVAPRYNGLKATDNDGPRPQDRFFFAYNGYSGVNSSVNPAGFTGLFVNRELIGLEKTLLDGDASVGLRLPFVQTGGASGFEAQDIGDLTIATKWALINDPATGRIVTAGFNVTVPTGGRGENLSLLDDGTRAPRAVFLQPWAGAGWVRGDWFAQGVSALLVPTDDVFPTVWFNSLGAGYWLYRNADDRLVRGIAPVVELHVNTPLTNRSTDAPIFFRDQANVTAGLQIVLPRLTIGGAVCVPLVGPKPYDIEALATINYQF